MSDFMKTMIVKPKKKGMVGTGENSIKPLRYSMEGDYKDLKTTKPEEQMEESKKKERKPQSEDEVLKDLKSNEDIDAEKDAMVMDNLKGLDKGTTINLRKMLQESKKTKK